MSQIIVGVDDTERAADAVTRVLVVYASTHGHTGTIAARIAEAIGPAAELHRIDDAGQHAPWEYDAIVVGASAHRRRRLASGAGFSGWPLRWNHRADGVDVPDGGAAGCRQHGHRPHRPRSKEES